MNQIKSLGRFPPVAGCLSPISNWGDSPKDSYSFRMGFSNPKNPFPEKDLDSYGMMQLGNWGDI